jgi:lipoteichoic acid synthase
VFWEFLLYALTGISNIKFYFLLFIPAEAVLLATLNGWFNKKINRFTVPIIMLIPFTYYISQMIYYRIFGSFFSISMIGMGADAMGDFGWALWDSIKNSVGWILLFLLPIVLILFHSLCAPNNRFYNYSVKTHLLSLAKSVCLFLISFLLLLPFGKGELSPYYAISSSYIDTDTASNRLGTLTNSLVELGHKFFGTAEKEPESPVFNPTEPIPSIDSEPSVDQSPNIIESIDFDLLKSKTTNAKKQALCEYFASATATNKNKYTGILKDYNLIYICAESFSNYAIDPIVTPTLYKMSTEGIILKNYYNSFKNTTTNGEFSFLSGLWPDVSRKADSNSTSGTFVQSKNNGFPYSLANVFNNQGIGTYAFHNFKGYYYQREKTHKNLGYQHLKFMGGENGMEFTTSWPSSDYEMMEQSIDDYINDERFHAYYMTFSGHGPYSESNLIAQRNLETVDSLLGDSELTKQARYYLAANYELEKAISLLLEKLEAAGKLNNTMIVIAGDHYPYYLSNNNLNSLAGKKVEKNFDRYKSSCIMYCPGIETVEVDTPCCNVDILPTVYNLFGFEYDSRMFAGVDIFSSNTHIAILYNKSFVTNMVKYDAQNGKAEWLPASDNMSESEKEAYLDALIATTKLRYSLSLDIINTDFYKFVQENISVPTEENIIQ